MTSDELVAEARLWIGTPYVHQASVRGHGADCLGLLRGLWRSRFKCEPEPVQPYSEDWAEPQRIEVLEQACRRHMERKPVEHEELGDVLLFRMRQGAIAKHLGLQSRLGDQAKFIHAFCGHGVIESSLSLPWQRRCVARFAFPLNHERGN